LRSVTASTREYAKELLKAAAAVPVKTEIEVFGFERANELLARLKESRVKGAAVLKMGSDG
jgi:propanol-preferring alcohol dehydrogenase